MAFFAVLSTAVACILIITQTLIDFYKDKPFIKVIKHDEYTLEHTILSFSAMLLLHGGASVFPTINADMVNPEKFPKSIGITFASKLFVGYLYYFGILCFECSDRTILLIVYYST